MANEMATDFKVRSDPLNPAFLFHLGDVITARTRPSTTASASTARTRTTQEKSWQFPEITTGRRSRRPMSRH